MNYALKPMDTYFALKTSDNSLTMPITPNDPDFTKQWALKNTGSSAQGSGTVDADIDAELAWDITTGSSSVKVAVLDYGIDTDHEDLSGKVSGDTGESNHGTAIAGIIAAKGNNNKGITGVAYGVNLINESFSSATPSNIANALVSARNRGAKIMNYSFGGSYSVTRRRAIRDNYKLNNVFITSIGNDGDSGKKYPATIKDGVITVGATTNTDAKASYSNTGSWLDVVAPGGSGSIGSGDLIYTTISGGGYSDYYQLDGQFVDAEIRGTSFAAPHVAGIAALLLSENPNLYNDDIENLIEISAEDINNNGFDNSFGHGRVNAHKALKLLQSPYVMNYNETTGGSVYSTSSEHNM